MSVEPFRCRLVWRMGVHGRVAEVSDAVVDGCTCPVWLSFSLMKCLNILVVDG